jgi:hypothetical protein
MIASAVKVDDVALAWVLEHRPIRKEWSLVIAGI